MKKAERDFEKLHKISRHARVLHGISSLLDWDQETYMPQGSAPIRSEQLKTLAGMTHREKTGPKFSKALSKMIDLYTGDIITQGLSQPQEAALREWRRHYILDTALPIHFVENFTELTSQSIVVWRKAKHENNFKLFQPYLEKIVEMNRQKADYLKFHHHPYDALMDHFEPDLRFEDVNKLFKTLAHKLTPIIKKIISYPNDNAFLFGQWDRAKQIQFSHLVLEKIGYDFNVGRLDFSEHPFSSSSHPSDNRITTRIHPTSVMSNISVILHEGGHALYEMGLPQESYGTPLGDARSLGVHESQSRWWETRIGLSKPFWSYFLPILKQAFPGQLDSVSLDQFYRAVNKVKPSMIRVEADEATYPLHVIIRFEIEKSLIEGSLKVKDIPEMWNSKMHEYLGITPANDTEGCLQDIHWAMGTFGYFPTYALGNLYAAHLFEGFAGDHSNWEERVSKGDLLFIKDWLKEKVYKHGQRYKTLELLKNATGKDFSPDAYLKYIENKYDNIGKSL